MTSAVIGIIRLDIKRGKKSDEKEETPDKTAIEQTEHDNDQ